MGALGLWQVLAAVAAPPWLLADSRSVPLAAVALGPTPLRPRPPLELEANLRIVVYPWMTVGLVGSCCSAGLGRLVLG